MEKEFVPYEQALTLKELGFDEPCFAFHNYNHQLVRYMNPDKDWNSLFNQTIRNSKITLPDTYTAPTFSQAFRWFREKYNINTVISWRDDLLNYDISLTEMKKSGYFFYKENFKSYEEAELTCLEKLIEIVESKSK